MGLLGLRVIPRVSFMPLSLLFLAVCIYGTLGLCPALHGVADWVFLFFLQLLD